jgi:hypothetical protein
VPTDRLGDHIEEIERHINHYTRLPHPPLGLFLACWIANTYCFEEFRYCGYVGLRSATPQCGKTKLLRLVGAFSKGNPSVMTLPTAAVLYRCGRSVLLIDEVDRLRNQDRDVYGAMLSVLNSGFEQGGAIERNERVATSRRGTVTDGYEVRSYSIYGPKAFAGIERLADTLADRTFMIEMARAPDRTPRLNMRHAEASFITLRTAFEQWANSNRERIQTAYAQFPQESPHLCSYDDRFQDISEPLVILATLADSERPEKAPILPRLLEGLRLVAGRRVRSGRERGLLRFIDAIKPRLNTGEPEVFISTASLLIECQNVDELAWIESAPALARFLGNFDLAPRQSANGQCRGYLIRRDWINRWESAYRERAYHFPPGTTLLPAPRSVEVSEAPSGSGDSTISEVSEREPILTA